MYPLNEEQINLLLPEAFNAAVRAGAAILEIYEDKAGYEIDIKSDQTPITEADLSAHATIKEYLGQTLIPVLSEEGRQMVYAERMGWELFWMVDPLDGTKEFIKGNGEFTVNIALMADNEPVVGVIYVPFTEKIYFADRNSGSFRLEGVKARPTARYTIEQIRQGAQRMPLTGQVNDPIRIAMSRSHNTPQTYSHIARLMKDHPRAEIVEQGSSFKFCMLAEGTVEYYARMTHTSEWDTAAGELILRMAGGVTRSLADGNSLRYNKEELLNPYFEARSCHFK